jgi:hypothetical protein
VDSEAEAARIAMEAEAKAARRLATDSTSAHHPVVQSPECKQAEIKRYKFWLREIVDHSITYLQVKIAYKSPSPQALHSQFAEQLGNVSHFYAGTIHQIVKATRTTQICAQVAKHSRQTRSFLMQSMQVFLMIAS